MNARAIQASGTRRPDGLRIRATQVAASQIVWLSVAASVLMGCPQLPFLRPDPTDPDRASQGSDFDAIEAGLVDLLDLGAVDAALVALDEALQSSPSDARTLHRLRADALLDMAVLADVLVDTDPIGAESLYLTVARHALRADDVSPDDNAVVQAILLAMRDGGRPETDVLFARELLQAAFRADEDERWYGDEIRNSSLGPHARLMALARAMRRFGAWARRGTGGGGDALVRDCGFLCDATDAPPTVLERAAAAGYRCRVDDDAQSYDDAIDDFAVAAPGWDAWELLRTCGPLHVRLPATPGSPLLLSEANWLDALLLRNLAALRSAVQADGALQHRVTVSAAPFLSSVVARTEHLAIPQTLTANVFERDLRLDLPRAFEETGVAEAAILATPPRLRMALVRSDGVWLALRPHLQLVLDPTGSSQVLVYAEAESGYHVPGVSALPFERPGAIAGADLTESGVPRLHDALVVLEQAVQSMPWVSPEEREASARALSVLVDGDTYFSSLEPVVMTASAAGYAPILLHTWHAGHAELTALPVRVGEALPVDGLRLTVREDGYVLQRADGTGDSVLVSRVTEGSLVTLHRAALGMLEGLATPTLAVQIDDGTADFGILANLVSAMAYARPLTDAMSDIALLRAVPEFAEGAPALLFPAGIFVASDQAVTP